MCLLSSDVGEIYELYCNAGMALGSGCAARKVTHCDAFRACGLSCYAECLGSSKRCVEGIQKCSAVSFIEHKLASILYAVGRKFYRWFLCHVSGKKLTLECYCNI